MTWLIYIAVGFAMYGLLIFGVVRWLMGADVRRFKNAARP